MAWGGEHYYFLESCEFLNCVVVFSWFSGNITACWMILLQRLEQEACFCFVMIFLEVTCISILYFFLWLLAGILPRMNFLILMSTHLPIFQPYRDCKCWEISVWGYVLACLVDSVLTRVQLHMTKNDLFCRNLGSNRIYHMAEGAFADLNSLVML